MCIWLCAVPSEASSLRAVPRGKLGMGLETSGRGMYEDGDCLSMCYNKEKGGEAERVPITQCNWAFSSGTNPFCLSFFTVPSAQVFLWILGQQLSLLIMQSLQLILVLNYSK